MCFVCAEILQVTRRHGKCFPILTADGVQTTCVYILEVGGGVICETAAGKSISVSVRVVRASGRGEAVWASESCFDCEARAVLGKFGPPPHPRPKP